MLPMLLGTMKLTMITKWWLLYAFRFVLNPNARHVLFMYRMKTGFWKTADFQGDICWDSSLGISMNGKLHWVSKKRTHGWNIICSDLQ